MRTESLLVVVAVCGLVAVSSSAWPATAQAQGAATRQAAQPTIPVLQVEGQGAARVVPDRARMAFAVESRAATAEEATAENARRTAALLAALREADLSGDAIETRSFGVHPIHVRHQQEEAPRLEGYRAFNVVAVRVDDLDRVGSIIDAAVRAGADRVERMHFEVADPQAAQRQALADAVENARAAAETLAESLGVRVGRVLEASTGSMPPEFPVMRMALETDAVAIRPETPIEPGEQTITMTVHVVFAIDGPAPAARRR